MDNEPLYSQKLNDNTRILVIDDAKDILALLEFELSEENYQVLTAESAAAGLAILNKRSVDLILLDIVMPEMSGLEALAKIKSDDELKDIPVIMLSASEQSEDIVAALDLGAADFVSKPYIYQVLTARIRTSLRLQHKTRALQSMALTDFLTKINNRRQFYALAKAALSKNKKEQDSLSIAVMDIDHFKQINDTYGHDIGDQVLIGFSKFLASFFREYDIVGRVGGEEFCVCLPGTGLEKGFHACERFRQEFENHPTSVLVDERDYQLNVRVSIGISEAIPNSELDLLIKQADKALYTAKNNGRNCVAKYLHDL